jgi:hypothetical protein
MKEAKEGTGKNPGLQTSSMVSLCFLSGSFNALDKKRDGTKNLGIVFWQK